MYLTKRKLIFKFLKKSSLCSYIRFNFIISFLFLSIKFYTLRNNTFIYFYNFLKSLQILSKTIMDAFLLRIVANGLLQKWSQCFLWSFSSPSHFYRFFRAVPRFPAMNGIIAIFIVYNLFAFLAGFRYFLRFSISINFDLWSTETAESISWKIIFIFFLAKTEINLLVWIGWFVYTSKFQRFMSFFTDRFRVDYILFVNIVRL